jgi:2-iminobutanoate/2-iminopropanoate deaminase
MPRKPINSDAYSVPIAGFSQLVVAPPDGSLLFLSGLTSRDAEGRIVGEGDVAAQTRQVLDSMRAVLAAAGAGLDDVIKIQTFVRRIDDWPQIEAVWREYWTDSWPASTLVEVSRLFDERQLIEIDAIARVERTVEASR